MRTAFASHPFRNTDVCVCAFFIFQHTSPIDIMHNAQWTHREWEKEYRFRCVLLLAPKCCHFIAICSSERVVVAHIDRKNRIEQKNGIKISSLGACTHIRNCVYKFYVTNLFAAYPSLCLSQWCGSNELVQPAEWQKSSVPSAPSRFETKPLKIEAKQKKN